MSTAPPPPVPEAPPAAPEKNEVTIVSHSMLFYWWPVWVCGLILAGLTALDRHFMVIVPVGTKVLYDAEVTATLENREKTTYNNVEAIVVFPPKNATHRVLPMQDVNDKDSKPKPLFLHITNKASYGVLFTTVLMLVIVITNVPLRGMWSVMVITLVVLLSIIFGLADLWTPILHALSLLDIRINAGGYLFISLILLAIWGITLVFFDRQIYIVFTPGQFKVCTEIGGGEKVFDTMGMKMEKQRSNLFLHWILGLGSGDLIVRTAGAASEHFDLQNVLFIGRKVRMIEEMLSRRKVLESK